METVQRPVRRHRKTSLCKAVYGLPRSASQVNHTTRVTAVLLLALTTAPLSLYARTGLVSSIPGTLNVAPSGAATYESPIEVPPGIAGVAPQLSFKYDSQGQNGVLGVGWTLGGLSSVHRCAATFAQDGFRDGVDFDRNDRFCLDGQRLVVVNGAAYGGHGAEYRTEIDTFSRVYSYGSVAGGPEYFSVETKSGETLWYGQTQSARARTSDGVALSWLMERLVDSAGNALSVSYSAGVPDQPILHRIDYADGTASVQFGYISRRDQGVSYIGGSPFRSQLLVNRVSTYANSELVKQYHLAYNDRDVNWAPSQLSSIEECDALDECKPATTFDWHSTAHQPTVDALQFRTFKGTDASSQTMSADVNGDGIADLIALTMRGGTITLKTVTGTRTGQFGDEVVTSRTVVCAGNRGCTISRPTLGDFNNDGLTDVAATLLDLDSQSQGRGGGGAIKTRVYKILVLPADGRGAFRDVQLTNAGTVRSEGSTEPSPRLTPIAVDVNGDNMTDILLPGYTGGALTQKVFLSNGGGFTSDASELPSNWQPYTFSGDFNGDSWADWALITLDNGGFVADIGFNKGDGTGTFHAIQRKTLSPPSSSYWHEATPLAGDFNGDGIMDLTAVVTNTRGFFVRTALATGDGSFLPASEAVIQAGDFSGEWRELLADFNGDGRLDLAIAKLDGAGFDAWITVGNRTGVFSQPVAGPLSLGNFNGWRELAGDFNGDGKSDLAATSGNGTHVAFASGPANDLIGSITNGLGVTIDVNYKPLTDPTIYQKGTVAATPEVLPVQAPIYVVADTRTDNGIGGQKRIDYAYEDLRINLRGRSLLGFRSRTEKDRSSGITTTTTYFQGFPLTGQIEEVRTSLSSNGQLLGTTRVGMGSLPTTGRAVFAYVGRTVEREYDLVSAQLLSTVDTTNVYDPEEHEFGNPISVIVETRDDISVVRRQETINQYVNDVTRWRLARLTQSTVTTSGGEYPAITRTARFAYNHATGQLAKETIEPGHPQLELVTQYSFDSFGNTTSVTKSGPGVATRKTTTEYTATPRGLFPGTVTNALGHQEFHGYDRAFGGQTLLLGPNGLTTKWAYDSLGRKVSETRTDGTVTTQRYEWCDGVLRRCADPRALYSIRTTTSGSADQVVYYDRLNREVDRLSHALYSGFIYVKTEYDAQGRVARKSLPYLAGTSPHWVSYEYDALGRVTEEHSTVAGRTTTHYEDLTTTTTNAKQQVVDDIRDALGRTVETVDAENLSTIYKSDPLGNLKQVVDPSGNIATNEYNSRGHRIGLNDPDMGVWSYVYNAFGELVQQTDAKGQVTSMRYDELGRMIERSETEGVTSWVYDTAPMGTGKLASVTQPGYHRAHTYDALGRPDTTITTVGMQSDAVQTRYDAFGRVDTLIYPGGFEVQNVYNDRGYLVEVRDPSDHALVYWEALRADAGGRLSEFALGNGLQTIRRHNNVTGLVAGISTGPSGSVQNAAYVYDPLGNLTYKQDRVQESGERFTYDMLNRLETSREELGIYSETPELGPLQEYRYDVLGNITFKPDVGTYDYTDAENPGTQPHAVKRISGAQTWAYVYDANGNMTAGAGRTMTWFSYNKPQRITLGNRSTVFRYGPDRARYQQIVNDDTVVRATTYIGGIFERVRTGSLTENIHYIRAGESVIAVHTTRTNDTQNTHYLHRDHLGSIEVITDEVGEVVERLSYTAFGERRATFWSDPMEELLSPGGRGYTGHEHLDSVGLIHMNGRVYDPIIGRFLSADPFVQFPKNLQSLNRYSYVLNNPLSFTDPSGFFLKKLLKNFSRFLRRYARAIVSTVMTVAINAAIPGLGGAVAAGFTGGFVGSGGDLKAALRGAATAAAFFRIGQYFRGAEAAQSAGYPGTDAAPGLLASDRIAQVFAHGVVGGASSVAGGGKFGPGFLGQAFSKIASGPIGKLTRNNPTAGTVAAATVGGTVSRISGGKFANGAVTGAFGYLFNELGSRSRFHREAVYAKSNGYKLSARRLAEWTMEQCGGRACSHAEATRNASRASERERAEAEFAERWPDQGAYEAAENAQRQAHIWESKIDFYIYNPLRFYRRAGPSYLMLSPLSPGLPISRSLTVPFGTAPPVFDSMKRY